MPALLGNTRRFAIGLFAIGLSLIVDERTDAAPPTRPNIMLINADDK